MLQSSFNKIAWISFDKAPYLTEVIRQKIPLWSLWIRTGRLAKWYKGKSSSNVTKKYRDAFVEHLQTAKSQHVKQLLRLHTLDCTGSIGRFFHSEYSRSYAGGVFPISGQDRINLAPCPETPGQSVIARNTKALDLHAKYNANCQMHPVRSVCVNEY